VKPAVLQRLMRHANIATTMGYYVALDSADVADDLWTRFGTTEDNISGNSSPETSKETEKAPVESSTEALK
jgi:hypothetical protein